LKIKILQKIKPLSNSQNHNTHCKVFAVAFFVGNKDIGYLCKVQISQAKETISCLSFPFVATIVFTDTSFFQ
jgi:hypothetical protein